MTMSIELSEEEVGELERLTYAYYDDRIAELKLLRKTNGLSENLTQEDELILQAQARRYFEKKKDEATKLKNKYRGGVSANEYLRSLGSIEPTANFTKEQYYALAVERLHKIVMNKTGKPYIMTEETQWVLEMLSCYFAEDDDFYWYANKADSDGNRMMVVDGDCDLKKGLAFFGKHGVGKSITLTAFAVNPRLSYACINAKQLPAMYQTEGFEGISRYYSYLVGTSQKHYGQRQIGLFVDEVYAEVVGTNFGGVCETAESVLYERWERLPGYYTHIATNHKREELESRYGSRFKSRLNGNMNLLRFPRGMQDFRN